MGDQASERIGSPVVVVAGGISQRRSGSASTRGTTLALRKISCRLHDGVLLEKRKARSNMRTPLMAAGFHKPDRRTDRREIDTQ
jgi:hypothetical protein